VLEITSPSPSDSREFERDDYGEFSGWAFDYLGAPMLLLSEFRRNRQTLLRPPLAHLRGAAADNRGREARSEESRVPPTRDANVAIAIRADLWYSS